MRRRLCIFSAVICSFLLLTGSRGQTPAPIILQAATPVPARTSGSATAATESSSGSTLERLQQMQAVNDATIKKQEAALATLDELQKAAEEIKIFSKRG
jgi:hypothetical protein